MPKLALSFPDRDRHNIIMTAIKDRDGDGDDTSTKWQSDPDGTASSAGERAIDDISDMLWDAPWWLTKGVIERLQEKIDLT